jgi:16S rRNA (uracil1498-N3)-methyltransferase
MAPHPDYPRTRLFVEAGLASGAIVPASREQAHYLHQVLRLQGGGKLALFNGKDGEWLARIAAIGKSSAELACERQLRPQKPAPDIGLLFAPLKHAKSETIVEKATELGVSRLQPVFTQHGAVPRMNAQRLSKLVVEAAEQCERLDVPVLAEVAPLETLLSGWETNAATRGRKLLFADESGKSPPLPAALEGLCVPLDLLIGPEGGFSAAELERLHALPFARGASLGPRILKADTAAFTLLACVMAACGDWDDKPAFRTI